MKKISQLLPENPSSESSATQPISNFDDVELTSDEEAAALLQAKKRKRAWLREQEMHKRAEETRKLYTQNRWSFDMADSFMRHRAGHFFGGAFKFDGQGKDIYQLLCAYVSEDERFFEIAERLGIDNPSFSKGIYLGGNFGVGKTWMMKLFSRNQRQIYAVVNAKFIANTFQIEGVRGLDQYVTCPSLPVNDMAAFYHQVHGLCIDDIGTEEPANNYGNKRNPVADVIELRYANGNTGPLLHVTTNMTGEQMKTYYGDRVASRLRECMNIVSLVGKDLRK